MTTPQLPKSIVGSSSSSSYFELVGLLVAGTAIALLLSWVFTQFPQIFPGVTIPPTQKLIMSAFPVLIAVARWCAVRINQVRSGVEANTLLLTAQKEKLADIEETVKKLDKAGIWNQVQIENIYSRLSD